MLKNLFIKLSLDFVISVLLIMLIQLLKPVILLVGVKVILFLVLVIKLLNKVLDNLEEEFYKIMQINQLFYLWILLLLLIVTMTLTQDAMKT